MLKLFKKIGVPAPVKKRGEKIKIEPKPIKKPVTADAEYIIHSDIPIKANADGSGSDVYKAKAGTKLYLVGDSIYYLTFECEPGNLFDKNEIAQFDIMPFTMPACEIYIRLISAE